MIKRQGVCQMNKDKRKREKWRKGWKGNKVEEREAMKR